VPTGDTSTDWLSGATRLGLAGTNMTFADRTGLLLALAFSSSRFSAPAGVMSRGGDGVDSIVLIGSLALDGVVRDKIGEVRLLISLMTFISSSNRPFLSSISGTKWIKCTL